MKPGHIKVFDGLRMTTEHIEHMQGAIHSALQEIRKILGLGRVYFGFEVSAEDDRIITVLPGLAFDHQGNRLVCDEPKTVPISFELEEEVKFVCLKYGQVEVGQVEGHFTMIWDSCSVLLRSTLPEPRENLVAVARVNKSMEGGISKLTINSLLTNGNDESAIDEARGVSSDNHVIAATNSETITAVEVPAYVNINTGERVTAAVSGEETESIGELSISEAEASVGLAPESKPWRLQLRQGVVRLVAKTGSETHLSRLLLEPLRRELSDGDGQREIELMVKLAEEEIALDFVPASISFQTIVNTSLSITSNVAEGRPPATEVKYQATAQGEASFTEDAISQFGVSMIQSQVMAGSALSNWSGSELTENGIAHLPFADKSAQTQNGSASVFPFHNLLLVIKTEMANSLSFKVVCGLLWKGEITGEVIQSLETNEANILWETLAGWKAMGKSPTSFT